MVSMSHANAEYYFDRDVGGVVDFFTRKFEFTSVEAVPKFKDIIRAHNMDVDLAASGYNKHIAEEMEAMEKEFRPVIEGGDDEEDEEDDDEEEEEEEVEPVGVPVITSKTTTRFDEWLETTAIGKEQVPDDEPVPVDVPLDIDSERIQKAAEIISRNKKGNGETEDNGEDKTDDVVGELAELDVRNNNFGKHTIMDWLFVRFWVGS